MGDLLMPKDQEDLDQRELLTLEENKIPKMERLSIKLHIFKDLLPKKELEERFLTEETELTPGKPTKRLMSLMRSSSLNILKKRKLPRKLLSQLQNQHQLKPLQ